MKKLLLSAFVAFAMLASTKTLAQQGFGTNTPDKSAAVDIVSSKRGLLVPRLALTQTTDQAPIPSSIQPATSLFVYNTASVNDVVPGFYYWDGAKWVRFVSSSTEKNTVVTAGKNVEVNSSVSTDGLTTTYNVAIAEGTANGQVLVTKETSPGVFTSEWVNPDDFISGVNGITITPNPTTGVNEIGIGGSLTDTTGTEIATDPITGKTLAITGLEILDATAFNPATQNIMVMGADGILKQVAPKTLIEDAIAADNLTAKALSSAGGIITVNGSASVTNSVLKDVELGIANKSIGAEKLNPGTATAGQIATVVESTPGNKEIQYVDPSTAIGKDLTTDNIIQITGANADSSSSAVGTVLKDIKLEIGANSITAAQIATGAVGANELASGAVTADKLSTKDSENGTVAAPNTVPVANSNGTVTYKTVAEAAGEDLTTDGKIVIGQTGATSNSLTDAVLVATRLSIAPESITSADIKDGTITTTDIKAPNSSTDNNLGGDENMVMVTDTNGDVKWIAQSALANKDNYAFAAPLSKDAGTPNTTTGGTDYTVSIATASATTLGVVKQSAATGEEITIATDGSLSINEANVNVGLVPGTNTPQGDVFGTLSNLTVGAIQGIPVSDVDPTSTNNMLVFQNGRWEPSTVAAAAGKTLTGAGITVTPGANATPGTATSLASTVLADVTLGIANDAITNDKLADDAVKTENIENGAVTNEDLALKAVTADKMESKNIATGTNVAAGMVPTADGSGGVEYKTINNTVAVINGLRKDATAADVIKLGGDLIEATAINTSVGSTGNTLAITGLANVAPATATKNKVIVAETTGGVLRTVDKIVTGTNVEVAANANYSFHTPEVVINVTLGNTDQTITFPSAASAEGQVINIKIANTTEAHTGYLNVLDTYGAMPYQAWIVKSNGTTWEIVGRN